MNKKGLIVGILVVLVAGVAIWKVASNNSSNDVANNVSEKSEASQGEDSKNGQANKSDQNDSDKANQDKQDSDNSSNNSSKNDENNSGGDNSAIVSNIPGFTSENGGSSKSGKDNSSSSNNGNSKSDKNNNSSNKSNTMSLPYTIASTGMKVTNIGKYSGKFVENGSDKSVSNVLSIVVTNTSNKDLQYGEIKLKAGGKTATFKLTNIPSGKSVLALEANGMKYSSGAGYKYADATYALTNMPMNSNKVKVSTSDSKVTIKNTSGKYIKNRPNKKNFSELLVLYELLLMMGKNQNISIEKAIWGEKGLNRIYNLTNVMANEYFDRLDAAGYIRVDRTAGLDMIYLIQDMNAIDVLEKYYKSVDR